MCRLTGALPEEVVAVKPVDQQATHEVVEFLRGADGSRPEVTVIGAGSLLVELPDADWSIRLHVGRPRHVSVHWQVTVREQAPHLGTWWTRDECILPLDGCHPLGEQLRALLSREMTCYRRMLSENGDSPAS